MYPLIKTAECSDAELSKPADAEIYTQIMSLYQPAGP